MPWVTPSVWSVRTNSTTYEPWSVSSTEPCHASAWKVSTIQRLPRLCLQIHAGSQAPRVGAVVAQDGFPEDLVLQIAVPDPKVAAVAEVARAGGPPAGVLFALVSFARPVWGTLSGMGAIRLQAYSTTLYFDKLYFAKSGQYNKPTLCL